MHDLEASPSGPDIHQIVVPDCGLEIAVGAVEAAHLTGRILAPGVGLVGQLLKEDGHVLVVRRRRLGQRVHDVDVGVAGQVQAAGQLDRYVVATLQGGAVQAFHGDS